MKHSILWLLLLFSLTATSQTYYIVRHAEKATSLASNPPLTREGEKRAEALKELLKNKNINYIFSTNFIRTQSTAKPLSKAIHIPIETYADADSAFIKKIRSLKKNTLIVGHSNTIDNIANALTNAVVIKADIADSVYNNLFIVIHSGKKVKFEARKY